MGYYVDMELRNIAVKCEKEAALLAAINEMFEPARLARDGQGGQFDGSKWTNRWYSWVENPPNGKFDTLEAAITAWGFDLQRDGDLLYIKYHDTNKLGQEELFFEQIAPFVEHGAEVRCTGEEGGHWRWRFVDGKVFEEHGHVVYEQKW